jgi:hypothetical protein
LFIVETKSIILSNPAGDETSSKSFSLTQFFYLDIMYFSFSFRFDVIFGLVEYGGKCNVDNNKDNFSQCKVLMCFLIFFTLI